MTPDGWRSARLGGLARVNPEQLGNRTNPDYVLEYLDIAAVERPGVIGARRTLTFAEAPSRARRRARTGDILVSTVRPYLRNFAHVREAPSNLVASTGYAVVRPTDEVDGPFLYQHVLSDAFVEFLKLRMSGSNYPAVKSHDVGAYTLFLPPLAEQRKIAAILSSVDDAIEKTQAAIDQVQVVKRGLMQELLTRGLPGRHTRFKQAEIGEIPETWKVVSLAECGATVTSGSRGWAKYYSDDGALFIRISNLARSTIRLQLGDTRHVALLQGSAEGTRTRVQPEDLVISITADLGMIGVIPQDIGEAYVNQHLALVRLPGDGLRPEFAGYFLTTDTARNRFHRLNDSSAKAGLSLPTIKKLTVPQPPRDEQDAIVQILSTTEDRLEVETNKLAGLAMVKSSLRVGANITS